MNKSGRVGISSCGLCGDIRPQGSEVFDPYGRGKEEILGDEKESEVATELKDGLCAFFSYPRKIRQFLERRGIEVNRAKDPISVDAVFRGRRRPTTHPGSAMTDQHKACSQKDRSKDAPYRKWRLSYLPFHF